jgi:DNA-binding Xre family transcriptional regulator
MNTTTAAGAYGADVEVAHQIRNALIVQGINHKELSSKTGISYSTLRRSLDQTRADRRSLTVQEITKIAAALEVQPSVILPATLTQQDAA